MRITLQRVRACVAALCCVAVHCVALRGVDNDEDNDNASNGSDNNDDIDGHNSNGMRRTDDRRKLRYDESDDRRFVPRGRKENADRLSFEPAPESLRAGRRHSPYCVPQPGRPSLSARTDTHTFTHARARNVPLRSNPVAVPCRWSPSL